MRLLNIVVSHADKDMHEMLIINLYNLKMACIRKEERIKIISTDYETGESNIIHSKIGHDPILNEVYLINEKGDSKIDFNKFVPGKFTISFQAGANNFCTTTPNVTWTDPEGERVWPCHASLAEKY